MPRFSQLLLSTVALALLLTACSSGASQEAPPSETGAQPSTGAAKPTPGPGAPAPTVLVVSSPAPEAPDEEASSSTQSPDWATIVREELAKLPVGRILFNPPANMRMGQTERVEVRIAQDETTDLTEGLQGRGTPEVEPIKVSAFMKARLVGDSFEITPLNDAEQLVAGDTFTEWSWDVTPLQGGDQKLNLIVTVRLQLPSVGEETRDYPVINRSIHVQVDPIFSVRRFFGANWQWLVTVIAIPVAGWAIKEMLERRKWAKNSDRGEK